MRGQGDKIITKGREFRREFIPALWHLLNIFMDCDYFPLTKAKLLGKSISSDSSS